MAIVRHSSTSPKQQQRSLPLVLSVSSTMKPDNQGLDDIGWRKNLVAHSLCVNIMLFVVIFGQGNVEEKVLLYDVMLATTGCIHGQIFNSASHQTSGIWQGCGLFSVGAGVGSREELFPLLLCYTNFMTHCVSSSKDIPHFSISNENVVLLYE